MCSPKKIIGAGANVHLFQVDDCRLAFDVNSGSLHRLDPLAWSLAGNYLASGDWSSAEPVSGEWSAREVAEGTAELRRLQREKQLFTTDPGWEQFTPGPDLGLKALCLNMAHSCNLECGYCFVPDQILQEDLLMPPEVITKAIDLLLSLTPYRTLCIDFFGGEPLLNFDGVRLAIDYARDKGADKIWKFTLTTNTLLLDREKLDYLRKEGVSLVLSCDGRPETHNRYRVASGRRGSSAAVERRLRQFLASGACAEYYIRGTYTHHNLDFGEDVRYLAELGAESISLEPVVAPPEQEYALREEDLPIIHREYFRLARLLRQWEREGRRVSYYHFAIDLIGGPCAAKRMTGCGAGYQYLAVTPAGKIYPCHQLVGAEDYLMGNVDQGITAPQIGVQFRRAHLYAKEACRSCWARFLCGGGCHAQAALLSGDLFRPYPPACQVMKARLEGALYYLALGQESGDGRPAAESDSGALPTK